MENSISASEQENNEPKRSLKGAVKNERFPNIVEGLGQEDPGKFMQAIVGAGIAVGSIVSLWLKGAGGKGEGRHFVEGMVSSMEGGKIGLSYLEGAPKEYALEGVKSAELLYLGQRYPVQELRFDFQGVSREAMAKYLWDLVTGKNTLIKELRKDGTDLLAKVKLGRATDSGVLTATTEYGSNKLEIRDIDFIGLKFDDAMRKELLETGSLAKLHRVRVLTNGVEKPVSYKVYLDKELNKVKFKREFPKNEKKIEQRVALSKKQLIDFTKQLKANGYGAAWSDVGTEESTKKGILLNRAAGASASIEFTGHPQKPEPNLKIDWKAPLDQGIGRDAYKERFTKALDIIKTAIDKGIKIGEDGGEKLTPRADIKLAKTEAIKTDVATEVKTQSFKLS